MGRSRFCWTPTTGSAMCEVLGPSCQARSEPRSGHTLGLHSCLPPGPAETLCLGIVLYLR